MRTMFAPAVGVKTAADFGARAARVLDAVLLLLVGLTFLLRFKLVQLLNVNWDEFYYLAHVHAYLRGDLTAQFQTFHVHLFSWLPLVADDEVSQIMAARLVMYALALGSCGFIYLIARRFFSRTGGLFVVSMYSSISNVVEHGTSFRADPIGAFLFLASLTLLLNRRRRWASAVAAGVLMALAAMITIKAAIHLAGIAALFMVLLSAKDDRRRTFHGIIAFGSAFVAAFGLLYGMHRLGIAASPPTGAAQTVLASAEKVFLTHGLVPRWIDLQNALHRNPVAWALMTGGAMVLMIEACRPGATARRQLLMFSALSVPLLSVLVYRNAFPYFFCYVLAPAVLFGGVIVDSLARQVRVDGSKRALAGVVVSVGLVLATFLLHYRDNDVDATSAQRQVIAAVHEMFPEPVPYLDGPAMIGTFPKAGFFMSKWGVEAYLEAGRPVIRDAIVRDAPVLLVINNNALNEAVLGADIVETAHSLLDADRIALRENYIAHWGIVYVAGKTLRLEAGTPRDFDVLIPGRYTVEAAHTTVIDDVPYGPGAVIDLGRGRHTALCLSEPSMVTLRWGQDLFRPNEPPSTQTVFEPFR